MERLLVDCWCPGRLPAIRRWLPDAEPDRGPTVLEFLLRLRGCPPVGLAAERLELPRLASDSVSEGERAPALAFADDHLTCTEAAHGSSSRMS